MQKRIRYYKENGSVSALIVLSLHWTSHSSRNKHINSEKETNKKRKKHLNKHTQTYAFSEIHESEKHINLNNQTEYIIDINTKRSEIIRDDKDMICKNNSGKEGK